MKTDDKSIPPASKAQRLMDRYNAAEGFFDKALVVIGGMKFTLILFAVWSGAMLWVGAVVFG